MSSKIKNSNNIEVFKKQISKYQPKGCDIILCQRFLYLSGKY